MSNFNLKHNIMRLIGICLSLLFFQQVVNAQIEMPDMIEIQDFARIDTTYTYEWEEETGKWGIYARDLHYIDESRLVTSVLTQRWYKDSEQWENYEQELKSHDENGNVAQSVMQQWNRNAKDWINVEMKTTTYDRRGNEAEILYQEWHRPTEEWLNTVVYLISYNRAFEKSEVIVRTYAGMENRWNNYLRFSFSYRDGYGPPYEVLVNTWKKPEDYWQTFGRYNLSYNNRGKVTQETRATWSESHRDWILGVRYLMSYRRDDIVEDVEQKYDYTSMKWVNTIRKTFEYDNETGALAREARYKWDKSDGEWEVEKRFLYTADKPDVGL